MRWRNARVAESGTHHEIGNRPLYPERFDSVLAFHEPGLAPVERDGLGWHITENAAPAYARRFRRTFGFYEGRAAAIHESGWLHVLPDGTDLAPHRYAWAGNFQGGRCTVRTEDGAYYHIEEGGAPAYEQRWRYAGDYRERIAVVQREDGLSSHIRPGGRLVHDRWYLDLDVFHKGAARARDTQGWTHIDRDGVPIYERRFAAVEPFYNGQARVEGDDGEMLVIDERGEPLVELRPPRRTPLQRLSEQMVGYWQTQAIHAAIDLGVPDALPSTVESCAAASGLSCPATRRLLRALWELRLVRPRGDTWELTETGVLLRSSADGSAADAARVWGGEHYAAWGAASEALRQDRAAFEILFSAPFFERLARRPDGLEAYQRAMRVYAEHDYAGIAEHLPLDCVKSVIDAGGGSGALLTSLLVDAPGVRGVLLERPEVARLVSVPSDLEARLGVIEGDLLIKWPCMADLIVLARVLHDWPDNDAVRILSNARGALSAHGRIAVVELVLTDDAPNGALLDLNMLVMCGSRERSRTDWDELADRAGLVVRSEAPLPRYGSVLVLEPNHAATA